MRLNGKEIVILPYVSETVDNDLVLYNEVARKIVVVNHSGAFIWKEIVEMYQNKKDLTTKDIANKIFQTYNVVEDVSKDIYDDIEKTILSFFDASLLKCKLESS